MTSLQRTDNIALGQAEALGGLLDVPLPDLAAGEGLPTCWHWLQLLDRPAQADLGQDGHPLRGTIPSPPEQGQRRMWAGGQVISLAPLRCGTSATRHSTVTNSTEKIGRSGHLLVVEVEHLIEQAGDVVIRERQDIVYRDLPSAALATDPTPPKDLDAGEPAIGAAEHEWSIPVNPTLLFRFSALTYNAHRIHYDRDYARDIEGYPGLITHGPLQALVMAELARRIDPKLMSRPHVFDYRLISPLFEHQGLIAGHEREGQSVTTYVRDHHGRRTATGTILAL